MIARTQTDAVSRSIRGNQGSPRCHAPPPASDFSRHATRCEVRKHKVVQHLLQGLSIAPFVAHKL
eukprot:3374349-Rhodomonas_salina.2